MSAAEMEYEEAMTVPKVTAKERRVSLDPMRPQGDAFPESGSGCYTATVTGTAFRTRVRTSGAIEASRPRLPALI